MTNHTLFVDNLAQIQCSQEFNCLRHTKAQNDLVQTRKTRVTRNKWCESLTPLLEGSSLTHVSSDVGRRQNLITSSLLARQVELLPEVTAPN